jgi:hypothetical protein
MPRTTISASQRIDVIASGTTATDDRAPAAERDEAQRDDREVHIEQHRAVGVAHDDVGRRFDARVARGKQEHAILVVVLPRELRAGRDDAVEGLRLVIGEIRDHGHHRALGIEEIRIVDRRLLRAVVEHVLVAADRQPFRVAFERAGGDLAHGVGERHRGLDARHLAQLPRQPVGVDQGLVLEAAFLVGLDDHGELIGGKGIVRRDVRVVLVVARVAAQLRGARIEVADLEIETDGKAGGRRARSATASAPIAHERVVKRSRNAHNMPRPFPLVSSRSSRRLRSAALALTPGVGKQHGEQQEVREDQHGDADARRQREVLDHRDVDRHQHSETDGIGEQRGQAGQEQPPERVARSHELLRAAADVLHDAVHLLGAVRHADREHEERHQNRERIELESEQRDQSPAAR